MSYGGKQSNEVEPGNSTVLHVCWKLVFVVVAHPYFCLCLCFRNGRISSKKWSSSRSCATPTPLSTMAAIWESTQHGWVCLCLCQITHNIQVLFLKCWYSTHLLFVAFMKKPVLTILKPSLFSGWNKNSSPIVMKVAYLVIMVFVVITTAWFWLWAQTFRLTVSTIKCLLSNQNQVLFPGLTFSYVISVNKD